MQFILHFIHTYIDNVSMEKHLYNKKIMKTLSLKNTLILLRVCIITLVLALISIFLISFTASRKIANDFWTALGITQPAASSSIRNSFMIGYLEHYSVRNPG